MATRQKMKDGSTVITGANLTMNDILVAVRNLFYPVGKIYISVDPASPAATLGGTWVSWGSGRVPVGVDLTQVEFDNVEEVGGTKLETLSIAQLPTHDHGGSTGNAPVPFTSAPTPGTTTGQRPLITGGGTFTNGNEISGSGHTHPISAQGSGLGHNNLQPYITCYMWKRTA